MSFAPIVLFVYARLSHTRLAVEALLKNPGAELSDLIIFSDAARTIENQENVDEVRSYLKTIIGFRSITIHHRPYNFGLAKSIIEGVTEVLKVTERVIVLEDDLVVSEFFLEYMNSGLDCYENDEQVASIHGYLYPLSISLSETFFIRGADCWGWGTWRRAWQYFNEDGKYLLRELEGRKLGWAFDVQGSFPYMEMLRAQIQGKNNSWAIRWQASCFLKNMLTLYPPHSLVNNIGVDGTGMHCGISNDFNVDLAKTPIPFHRVSIEESIEAKQAFSVFYRRQRNIFRRIANRLNRIYLKGKSLKFIGKLNE